jgi:hypothetical protein
MDGMAQEQPRLDEFHKRAYDYGATGSGMITWIDGRRGLVKADWNRHSHVETHIPKCVRFSRLATQQHSALLLAPRPSI